MGRLPHHIAAVLVAVAAGASVPGRAAADVAPCPPGAAHAAWLTPEVPAEVVFGRSLTVAAGVKPEVTDARLELRTAGGTLLAASTAIVRGPEAGAMRILDLPAPVGGTRSLTARLTFTARQGPTACRAGDVRTIRLVPGRLGRLRVGRQPGDTAVTVRTAAGEGCQDCLRASRIEVRLTDPGAPVPTAALESVHPCDGWTTLRAGRSPRLAVIPADANLVLRARRDAPDGRLRLTVLRAGVVVARGTIVVRAGRATYVRA